MATRAEFHEATLAIDCPACGARTGTHCERNGKALRVELSHYDRRVIARQMIRRPRELASA